MGGTKESSPGAWETNSREAVEQGEDMLHHLLGQGMESSESQAFESDVMETCGSASAPSLEDVRQAQGQVALTSEEHHDWISQVCLCVCRFRLRPYLRSVRLSLALCFRSLSYMY